MECGTTEYVDCNGMTFMLIRHWTGSGISFDDRVNGEGASNWDVEGSSITVRKLLFDVKVRRLQEA
jgi:hypothetical protein